MLENDASIENQPGQPEVKKLPEIKGLSAESLKSAVEIVRKDFGTDVSLQSEGTGRLSYRIHYDHIEQVIAIERVKWEAGHPDYWPIYKEQVAK